jgi:hypothetical protein
MLGYWEYRTSSGAFRVVPSYGRYRATYEGKNLGSYPTPQMAVDELVSGSTLSPPIGLDTTKCGLPTDLRDWNFLEAQEKQEK